ncbi:DNA processing protein DprA [Hydrogenophaga crassostreae]|uniref:DNA processing protein DprA n=1 Tax=Hydrogenophaga crassostreae TaxID=1763535 RepID=A0A167GBC8_9BURK|nr:DNA-processing protein DprA [Hydrogenophaga crassostreae]AOW15129.1 DNA protecting protein DprA [Hydrogenophaga crassostreae]OAD39219.1 DNA processing protein DprA [Hydrogenophaga crassostreae]
MARDELAAWLRLTLTPGVGNEAARKLLAAFGLPGAVFGQSPSALRAVVGERLATALQITPDSLDAEVDKLGLWLAPPDHHLLTIGDAAFPPALLQMADPPLLLYVVGQLEALGRPNKIAIVGSRNPTPQGHINARQFAAALGESGLCIVSGLALGVDGAAHEGALDVDAPTIAVVGTGLDRVYPKRHHDLAHRITERGAIVSEYALGTPPLPAHFPQRNRIIAGLCQGTLVIEAAVASGSLITARLATEMGREVFAIPGSIHAPQARGCHALIRQGAKLVESAQDVLEDLQWDSGPVHRGHPAPGKDEQPAKESSLLTALGHDPVSLDALQARTGLPTPDLQAQLLELELNGQAARLPGSLFQRLNQG